MRLEGLLQLQGADDGRLVRNLVPEGVVNPPLPVLFNPVVWCRRRALAHEVGSLGAEAVEVPADAPPARSLFDVHLLEYVDTFGPIALPHRGGRGGVFGRAGHGRVEPVQERLVERLAPSHCREEEQHEGQREAPLSDTDWTGSHPRRRSFARGASRACCVASKGP